MVKQLSPLLGGLGFAGALFFLLSIAILHVVRTDVDWTTHYVSDFVNGPMGWLFAASALLHGFGNMSLGLGLGSSLGANKVGPWASGLLVISATGILIAALFPTDPADSAITWVGLVHGAAVTASFILELAALFLFAIAFSLSRRWKPFAGLLLVLAVVAAAGLSFFMFLLVIGELPGLGERVALTAFAAWELWASFRLLRFGLPDG
jgi:hypothetical membrane protein